MAVFDFPLSSPTTSTLEKPVVPSYHRRIDCFTPVLSGIRDTVLAQQLITLDSSRFRNLALEECDDADP